MTIFELGALGEFLGAILLFISLIYIGIQIRQNTIATRAQIYQARATGAQDFFVQQALNGDLSKLITRVSTGGIEEIDRMTSDEYRCYHAWHLAGLARMDNNHYQYTQGFLDRDYYEEVLVPVMRHQGPIWARLELGIRPEFRRELDRILSEVAEPEGKQP